MPTTGEEQIALTSGSSRRPTKRLGLKSIISSSIQVEEDSFSAHSQRAPTENVAENTDREDDIEQNTSTEVADLVRSVDTSKNILLTENSQNWIETFLDHVYHPFSRYTLFLNRRHRKAFLRENS